MSKSPLLHAAQRVDLLDLQYGLSGFSQALQTKLLRSVYGSGVLDGFRIRIPEQAGNEKGHLIIYNGVATDWGGSFVNSETGTNSERIVLSAANMEYWIEVEVDYADTDPDSRAFWDPLIDNTDPIPDGREVQIPKTMTRQVPYWRVRRPIRSNPIGQRTDVGYTPSHFSPSTESVIPIAVIRTNSQRQIEIGDANTTSFGNDIVPVLTQEDAINPRNMLKVGGYGESHGTATAPYGRKFSDQRPRMFDPLLPSFQYGGSNEVLGDALHDGWARDIASVFDHLASQIKQIKTGAGPNDNGETSTCSYVTFADDFSCVDVTSISQNIVGPPLDADPDQFIGCTFQVVSGHWGGFYARITGNDRTSLHSAGETRLYLGRKSPIPEWMELPRGTISCQIVQHKEVNWLTQPCPSTGFRGLNSLDTEVYSSRTDWHSNTEFNNLRARLNAGKLATLTVSPVAAEDPDTGEPSDVTHPRADVFQSVTDIQTKVTSAFNDRGGIIHFRRGTYDFSSAIGSTAFSIANAESFIVEGDGSETTVLEFISPGFVRTIFALSGCKNILFKDLTIKSSGTPITLSGCEKIFFQNCVIEGEYVDLTTPTVSLDAYTNSICENTQFYVVGTGVVANNVNASMFRNCQFFQRTESSSNLDSIMNLGVVTHSRIQDCYFQGFSTTAGIECSSFNNSYFMNSEMAVTLRDTSNRGLFTSTGTCSYSKFHHLNLSNNTNVVGSGTFAGLKFNALSISSIDRIWFSGIVGGVYVVTDMARSSISYVRALFNNNAFGIQVDGLFTSSIVDHCSLVTGGASGVGIKIQGTISNSYVLYNDINSSLSIDKCIEINSSSISSFVVQGNTCSRAQYGIYFNDISAGIRIYIKDNVVNEIGTEAYKIKTSSNLHYFDFSGNTCENVSGIGLTIDSTGVSVSYSTFQNNNLTATIRAFEIWSLSGGGISEALILGNRCYSTDKSAFAIGHSASGTDPAAGATPYLISDCLMKHNYINTDSTTGLTYFSLYLSSVVSSIVSNNYVNGSYGSSTLFVEKGITSSAVNENRIFALSGTGSHGIHFKGAAIIDNQVCNNSVIHIGSSRIGIYFEQDTPAVNEAARNKVDGNYIKLNVGSSTVQGIHIDNGKYCSVSGNTALGYDVGIWVRTSNHCVVNHNLCADNNVGVSMVSSNNCMTSGNLCVNSATFFFDLAGAAGIKGGMQTSAIGGPKWNNDEVAGNYVQAYNVGV